MAGPKDALSCQSPLPMHPFFLSLGLAPSFCASPTFFFPGPCLALGTSPEGSGALPVFFWWHASWVSGPCFPSEPLLIAHQWVTFSESHCYVSLPEGSLLDTREVCYDSQIATLGYFCKGGTQKIGN